MMIVLAIPTIEAREDAWRRAADEWTRRTCQPLTVEPSWAGSTWAAGLNDVWRKHPDADLFICGSDDMVPENDYWLPAVEPWLEKGCLPAPTVIDPRLTYPAPGTADGAGVRMSTFPILKKEWLDTVFPLPDDLHYYSDDLIADRLRDVGVECVAVPDCRIVHGFDERGRGAGMGDEPTRMRHDRVLYRRLRRARGRAVTWRPR